jgi:hypothetical protein
LIAHGAQQSFDVETIHRGDEDGDIVLGKCRERRAITRGRDDVEVAPGASFDHQPLIHIETDAKQRGAGRYNPRLQATPKLPWSRGNIISGAYGA